jgi:two-component system LytT family response regulator
MLTALLVDDEPSASLRLAELLAAYPEITILGTAESVEEAQKVFARNPPDIVFLDVEMPGGSGLRLLESLSAAVQVCFVTAYPDYAVEAFDFGAVDYLLKPVDRIRLDKTISRLLKAAGTEPVPAALADNPDAESGLVSQSGGQSIVGIADILWIEAMGNYTNVFQAGGRIPILFRRTLAQWEAILPAKKFVRLGRSQLVQVSRISLVRWKSREETALFFQGCEEKLAIGRHAAARLREILDS